MKSIDIVQFRCDLENYIRQAELPAEVKRMVLSDICRKVSEEASQEITKQIEEKEKENVSESTEP
jgi:hypothetical protein